MNKLRVRYNVSLLRSHTLLVMLLCLPLIRFNLFILAVGLTIVGVSIWDNMGSFSDFSGDSREARASYRRVCNVESARNG